MINIFCIHPHGFNVGNDAIQVGLRHLLYLAFGRVVNLISLPAVSHYESHAKAGLTARTIHEINQYGHGVIVGGGNLYENGELAVDVEALGALEPPLLLYSLSRGGIFNRRLEIVDRTDVMPRRIIEALNRRADYSLARDQATLEYLHSIGFERAELGGCPTVYLDQVASQLPPLPEDEDAGVLLSVRHPSLMNVPLRFQAAVADQVSGLIELLRADGRSKVRLLCHDHRDIQFAATFKEVEYVYTGDVYYYLSLLRSCDLSIGFRLHAALPALAFGRPALTFCYDQRAISLSDTLHLEPWTIRLLETDDLVASAAAALSRLPDLGSRLQDVRAHWRSLFERNMEAFRRFAADVEGFSRLS